MLKYHQKCYACALKIRWCINANIHYIHKYLGICCSSSPDICEISNLKLCKYTILSTILNIAYCVNASSAPWKLVQRPSITVIHFECLAPTGQVALKSVNAGAESFDFYIPAYPMGTMKQVENQAIYFIRPHIVSTMTLASRGQMTQKRFQWASMGVSRLVIEGL